MSRKNELDQYYLNPVLFPWIFYRILEKCVPMPLFVLDQFAGKGGLVKLFIELIGSDRVFAYDIDPKSNFIIQRNALEHVLGCSTSTVLTICFPPFGRSCSLAIKFFNGCAEVSKFIVTVFPMSAKKQHFQSQLDLCFHEIYCADLPRDSFILDGKPYHVNCCFQIWEKLEYKRKICKRVNFPSNSHASFVKKEQNSAVGIIRTGRRAGKVVSCAEASKYTSVYYIKIHDDLLKKDNNIYKLDLAEIANNTVGQRGVSKPEILYAIELLMIKLLLPQIV